jgi:integral membrane protein
MLRWFRTVSRVEGISLLLLVALAMPLKYIWGNADAVLYIGSAHGMLWLLYLFMSLATSHRQRWSVLYWLWVLLLSILPGGFLWLDRRLGAELRSSEA